MDSKTLGKGESWGICPNCKTELNDENIILKKKTFFDNPFITAYCCKKCDSVIGLN